MFKLIKEGIDGKLLVVIKSMHSSITSCVCVNGQKAHFFGSCREVRQCENLSPILFSEFLNDLEQYFVAINCLCLNIHFNTADVDFNKYVQLLLLGGGGGGSCIRVCVLDTSCGHVRL